MNRSTSIETSTHTPFDVKYPANCIVFPELDVALGLTYEWCCDCCCKRLQIVGEVGYEFRTYLHALASGAFLDSQGAGIAGECEPFNLQGLYFGLRIQI